MGFFQSIGAGIRKILGSGVKMDQGKAVAPPKKKRRWSFLGIGGRKQPAAEPVPEPPAEPQPPAPEPPASKYGREAEALRRATEMLIEASQHPGDATWEYARQEALVYITKTQTLADKGATQTGNRRYVADIYLKKEISTPKGVERRKERKLEIFNANFGFQLTAEQADTVGQLMNTPSFKKLMETYKEKYDILIGMVGDQVELGVDPVRIEQQLDLWQQVGIEPDFSDFAKVSALTSEAFQEMRAELMTYSEESMADDFERAEDISGIMGRYVTW